MDFVVAGLGLGAIVVVIGFVVRDLGPLLWRFNHRGVDETDEAYLSARGLCHSISVILTIAGALILIATIIPVALGLSDGAGTMIVLVASIVGIVGSAIVLALTMRDWQPARSYAIKSETRQFERAYSTSVQSNASTTPLSVRPVRRPAVAEPEDEGEAPVAAEENAPEPVITEPVEAIESESELEPEPVEIVAAAPEPEPDLGLDEPFDATRLLASEFEEMSDEPLPAFGRPVLLPRPTPQPVEQPAAEPTVERAAVIEDRVIGEAPANVRRIEDAPPPEPASTTEPAPAVFQSKILADLDSPSAESGLFSSKLLADVDAGGEVTQSFQSPLLADLRPAEQPDEDDGDENAISSPAAGIRKFRRHR